MFSIWPVSYTQLTLQTTPYVESWEGAGAEKKKKRTNRVDVRELLYENDNREVDVREYDWMSVDTNT